MRFKLDLGLALGKSLGEIDALSERELQIWMAKYRLEPFGDERADLRAANATGWIALSNNPKAPEDVQTYKLSFKRRRSKRQEEKRLVRRIKSATGQGE